MHLSPREVHIVRSASQGIRIKEMAKELGLSPETVKSYYKLIRAKTQAKTMTEAVGKAVRAGVI